MMLRRDNISVRRPKRASSRDPGTVREFTLLLKALPSREQRSIKASGCSLRRGAVREEKSDIAASWYRV
eukprot:2179182-Pyramimonas_sp.AAC.1